MRQAHSTQYKKAVFSLGNKSSNGSTETAVEGFNSLSTCPTPTFHKPSSTFPPEGGGGLVVEVVLEFQALEGRAAVGLTGGKDRLEPSKL